MYCMILSAENLRLLVCVVLFYHCCIAETCGIILIMTKNFSHFDTTLCPLQYIQKIDSVITCWSLQTRNFSFNNIPLYLMSQNVVVISYDECISLQQTLVTIFSISCKVFITDFHILRKKIQSVPTEKKLSDMLSRKSENYWFIWFD